jgi:hypothetical protein
MTTDPSFLSPARWQSRLAALKSRGIGETDPGVSECRAALANWRVRRAIDAEAVQIAPGHADAVADRLRTGVPA